MKIPTFEGVLWKRITELEALNYEAHWSWGLAWHEVWRASTVLIRIPLNWPVKWTRDLYYQIRRGPREHLFLEADKEFGKQRNEAWKKGRELGDRDGYDRGRREATAKYAEILDKYTAILDRLENERGSSFLVGGVVADFRRALSDQTEQAARELQQPGDAPESDLSFAGDIARRRYLMPEEEH